MSKSLMMPLPNLPNNLSWTQGESEEAHKTWKASCGHHAIAAYLGISLEEVRKNIPHSNGWMSPTNITYTLEKLGVAHKLIKRQGVTLLNGINRIQFLGPWLQDPDPKKAYWHTHWVTRINGHVLDTAICSWQWIPLLDWPTLNSYTSEPPNKGWYRTHVFQKT